MSALYQKEMMHHSIEPAVYVLGGTLVVELLTVFVLVFYLAQKYKDNKVLLKMMKMG